MFTFKSKKLPKNTVEIVIDIPKADIASEKTAAFTRIHQELTVEGFRKGKVPEEIAWKHVSPDQIYQEMVRVYLPKVYDDIIKKEQLKPIANPKLELVKAKEGEDWQIRITLAEKPMIDLGKYKETIREAKKKAKTAEIWVPGKDNKVKEPRNEDQERSKMVNEVLGALLNEAKIEISDLIIDEELEHRLARLVDDVQKIGLTTESYLKSKGLTMEVLKAQFRKEIEDTYRLEFALAEISDKEGIKVDDQELDRLFVNIKDEKERQSARQNAYYYASIIRKQKTLDFLISL